MNPLVSVVMPVHNGGKFLPQAVDSILSQSFKGLELILVDDHSTDSALSLLDKSDPRLKVFNSKGFGVVNACNTGFSHSIGRFIARMDADDISLPERLEQQLNYLGKNPAIDIAGCCVEIFSDNGIKGGLERYQTWLNSVREPAQVHKQIFIESPLPNPGVMFRRAALEKLRGYRNKSWPEDYDLFLRADASNMRMGKPRPVLLRWREHESRLTHTDPLYSRDKFMHAKAYFLVRHRLKDKPVVIWGAGPTGRLMHDLIVGEGAEVEGFIDVHPRRIGGQKRGLPVWPVEKTGSLGEVMLLVAVGAAGAREEIAAFLHQHQKVEGRDYLFVA
ncbi:MAG: glycosyltransferase [Gammaproteobacteria bacterium]|nr:glycosyltransferase [Gammaproteobacteria bacterium]NNK97822.1 glycosyltransferase [Xanthomonadales bacterium]